MIKKKMGFHYCWVILLSAFLLSFSATTIIYNCTGLFIKPLSDSLGYSRTQLSFFSSFINYGSLVASPFMGSLLQRRNQKVIIFVCSIVMGGMLFLYSFCHVIWQFYIVSFIMGLATSGLTTLTITTLINRWFVSRKAFAMGVAYSGSAIGGALLTPLVTDLIYTIGWASAFRFLAVLLLAINLPISVFVLRNKPDDMNLQAYSSGVLATASPSNSNGFTRKQALSCPWFWIFLPCVLLFGMAGSGIMQHIVSYLTDIGYSSDYAAKITSGVMVCAVVAKLILGSLMDRVGVKFGTTLILISIIIASVCLLFAPNRYVLFLFIPAFGVGYCILSIPASLLTMQLFGSRDYGSIYGIVAMFLTGGISLGAPFSALLFDLFGSYRSAWILYGLLSALSILLISLIISRIQNWDTRKTDM